jgi:hypothetical protein
MPPVVAHLGRWRTQASLHEIMNNTIFGIPLPWRGTGYIVVSALYDKTPPFCIDVCDNDHRFDEQFCVTNAHAAQTKPCLRRSSMLYEAA